MLKGLLCTAMCFSRVYQRPSLNYLSFRVINIAHRPDCDEHPVEQKAKLAYLVLFVGISVSFQRLKYLPLPLHPVNPIARFSFSRK